VVVAAWNGAEALARCLAALVPQLGEGDELVVAHHRGAVTSPSPRARYLPCASERNVPQLRSAGLAATTGDIVAFLEDHAEPLPGWRDAVLAGFSAGAADAVGGPVAIGEAGAAIDDAVWFYDYARFAPPMISGPVGSLSGANMAFMRAALVEALSDVPRSGEEGIHEVTLERALHRRGRRFWLDGEAVVRVRRHEAPGRAIGLAFALARGYGARHVATSGVLGRLARVIASPVVPAVLFVRTARHVARRPTLTGRFVRASGWLLLLQGAWGVGEGVGALRGPGDADARWR
jgi:hypothetical protein